jgi:hypothetical protein
MPKRPHKPRAWNPRLASTRSKALGVTTSPVGSTAVKEFGYDAHSQSLLVTFTTGRSYAYKGVPLKTYQAMQNANSKGRFVNSAIKDKFPYSRLG